MVYAYAVLGHHPGAELLSAIAKGVQWQLRDFSPQVRCHNSDSCPVAKPLRRCAKYIRLHHEFFPLYPCQWLHLLIYRYSDAPD